MKIRVSHDRCMGHARCEAIAPEIFATDEIEGKIVLLVEQVPDALQQMALRGAKACPERAITVFGGEDGESQIWPPAQ